MLTLEKVIQAKRALEANTIYKVYWKPTAKLNELNLLTHPIYIISRTVGGTYEIDPNNAEKTMYPFLLNWVTTRNKTPYRILKIGKIRFNLGSSRMKIVEDGASPSLGYCAIGCLDSHFKKLSVLSFDELLQHDKIKIFSEGSIYADRITIQKLPTFFDQH